MKLNKDKQINFESTAVFEGYDAKISATDMHKLWDLLQNPYKNPIGAIVREYVSNSFDAHAEAEFIKNNDMTSIRNEYSVYNDMADADILNLKKHLDSFDNEAVHVKIAKDQSGWYWSTEDFGVGLSPERVRDVFCNYLKSTKEDTNNVIGAFGIGSKSGLSYADVVYIRTRYNSVEYQYFLRKGEKMPRLDKVSECSTNERNGTQIKVYIKEGKDRYDRTKLEDDRFKEECQKQLVYFDNVYFDGCEIENEYKILRGENWLCNNENSPFNSLHICLGKVAYPIDWDTLGMERIEFVVGLKFEIGELDIIQTREDVKYTPRTKKAIIDKIEALREEWKRRWEEDKELESDDLIYYFKNRDMSPEIEYEDYTFSLDTLYSETKYDETWKDCLKQFSFTPFESEGIQIPQDPFFDYESNKCIKTSGLRQSNRSVRNLFNNNYNYAGALYRVKDGHESRKSKYIRNVLEEGEADVFLIRKKSKYYYRLSNYVKYLGLEWNDRADWRRKIKLYQDTLLKSFIKNTKSYDRVVVDKQWIKDNYGARKVIDRTRIVAKQLLDCYVQGSNYSYHRTELIKCKIDALQKPLKIVGVHDDRYKIQQIAILYDSCTSNTIPKSISSKGSILTYVVAPTNLKYFKDVNNVVTIESFMSEHNKLFRKVMTVLKYKEGEEYEDIRKFISRVSAKTESWSKVYTKIAEDMAEIQEYITTYSEKGYSNYASTSFMTTCLALAEENDWFDYDFLDKVKGIEEYFEGLEMLHYVDYKRFNRDSFPYIAIARYIRNHNKAIKNIKKFKRLNPYYYVMFNEQEVEWLKGNEKEYEFAKERQDVKLKKVS